MKTSHSALFNVPISSCRDLCFSHFPSFIKKANYVIYEHSR